MQKNIKPMVEKKLSLRKSLSSSATTLSICIPTLMMSQAIFAQSQQSINLDAIEVQERTAETNPYAEPGAPYKAKKSGDKRHVKDIADTPKTMTVITQTQAQEAGKSDLRDIVAAQPGITLGTGENGNAFGDRYVIRGHEARSDVFVDNLADPGMTTRESFATEQIEITKGPSSTYAGRGSTGGTVNSITKQASTEYDFTKLQGGVGTDKYRRLTVDSNVKVNDEVAIRINALNAYEEVPDRGPTDKERNGLALSTTFEPNDKLQMAGDVYYLKAEDRPDLGTYIMSGGGEPVDDIPVYAQKQDFLDTEIRVATFRVSYDFSDKLSIDNSTRYGETENGYVVTGARGSTRSATDPDAPGDETVTLSTHQGWQEIEYFVNQTNLFFDAEIGGKENQFVFTFEYSDEKVLNGTYDINNTGSTNCVTDGRSGPSNSYCIVGPDGNYLSNLDSLMGRDIDRDDFDSDYQVKTTSLGVMDTITFSDQWSVSAGIRADYFDYSNSAFSRGATEPTSYEYNDTLFNYHLGTVYNITEEGNIYFTYSTADTINGGESDVGASCGYGGLCVDDSVNFGDQEPEHAENVELGTKWNVLNEKLLLSAALFQVTKSKVMEVSSGSYDPDGSINTGKNRVQGLELAAVGNLTEKLSGAFGAAFMDSEILKSASAPDSEGRRLSNFADNSVFLQLRYQATPKFAFGAIATYSSEAYAGQPDTAASYNSSTEDYAYEIPSYTVFDVFASYNVTKKLSARLNIGNITDEDYYLAAYRSGAFTYIGDARNAQLTLSYNL